MGKKKISSFFKKTYRRVKYYDKTQTMYFAVMIFIASFCLFTGATYSYFTLSGRIGDATITIAKLSYVLEGVNPNYINQTLTIAPNETVFLDLDLKSFNAQKTRYALNYDTNFSGVEVYYSENLKKNVDGIIGAYGSIINMRVVVVNNGTEDATVRFDIDGGYLQNSLSSNIVNGYFERDQTIRYIVYDEDFESSVIKYNIPNRDSHSYYKAECSNGGEPVWDEMNWTFSIGNDVQTSCDVYFKKTSVGLEKYYNVLGSNGLNKISTKKPDTTGEYIYQSSSCSNGAVYSFDESTFEFNVETYEPNTLCIANFTTDKEIEEADRIIITFDSTEGERIFVKEVGSGGTFGELPELYDPEFYLLGWFSEKEGGIKIEPNTPVEASVTIYAQWKPKFDLIDAVKTITNNDIPNGFNPGNPNFANPANSYEGVYTLDDDYGTSYYYRGNIKSNYLKFADHYWRIIRINGDGSVRIQYDGTSGFKNGMSHSDRLTHLGQVFNLEDEDAKYVGWMFGGAQGEASTSREQARNNETNSDIKTAIDSWYKTNIIDKNFGGYVADSIFCSDRSTPGRDITGFVDDTGLGYGTNSTAFGVSSRINMWNTGDDAVKPSFKCPEQSDTFTVSDKELGNGDLTYPVGLITADEASAAGLGKYNSTDINMNYLFKGWWYWTMTPGYIQYNKAINIGSIHTGGIWMNVVSVQATATPVINLKPEYVKNMKGIGSVNNPYILE